MDTVMTLTAYGENGDKALQAAEEEIKRLDDLFSINSEDGDVWRLNREKTTSVSEDSVYLLTRAAEISESTGGIFDCTVAPIMDAWGFPTEEYRIPGNAELQRLLKAVDYRQVQLDGSTVSIPANVEIDLGGIAKGYTSDRVMKIFAENGVSSGIISLGGNVQCLGSKVDGSPWRVAVQDPSNLEETFAVIEAEDEAIITSGAYQRYFEKDGKLYHHIVDPRNGCPANSGLLSATIVCKDGTLADGLSTSLFIMGLDDAITYWREHSDSFETILMTTDRRVYLTEGLAERCTLSNGLSAEIIS